MKIGLVIQGPIITFGQGPNNNPDGFNSQECILQNIKNFQNLVECIVVSTWENEVINFILTNDKVSVITSPLMTRVYKDNRLKQFITTYNGVEFIKGKYDVTHILKIRTDQLVDAFNIVYWMKSFFNESNFINLNKIVLSDKLKTLPFYLGDFIFAGRLDVILNFCECNINKKQLHPIIGIDYTLKYLEYSDNFFWNVFNRYASLKYQIQIRNSFEYWEIVYGKYFEIIPIEIFENIIWRGKKMSLIIPNYKNDFEFYKSNVGKNNNGEIYIKNNLVDILLAIISVELCKKISSSILFIKRIINKIL